MANDTPARPDEPDAPTGETNDEAERLRAEWDGDVAPPTTREEFIAQARGFRLRSQLVTLYEIDLSWAQLVACDLTRVTFERCSLAYADLRETDLSGATFHACDLRGAHLEGAHLEGARFLAGCVLSEAYAEKVNANKADFSGADMTRFNGAQGRFVRASFRGATLTDTSFTSAKLAHSDFSGVAAIGSINFSGADLSYCTFDNGAILLNVFRSAR